MEFLDVRIDFCNVLGCLDEGTRLDVINGECPEVLDRNLGWHMQAVIVFALEPIIRFVLVLKSGEFFGS